MRRKESRREENREENGGKGRVGEREESGGGRCWVSDQGKLDCFGICW